MGAFQRGGHGSRHSSDMGGPSGRVQEWGVKPQSLAGQGQALCSLLPLPRGPCDNPLSGIFHAETVAQRGPWERCEGRHHPSLPPGTGLPLLGVSGPLLLSHTCPQSGAWPLCPGPPTSRPGPHGRSGFWSQEQMESTAWGSGTCRQWLYPHLPHAYRRGEDPEGPAPAKC